jgi:hypothetical protein
MMYRNNVPDAERLAGLVFELASQLQVERSERVALELALERAGVLTPGAVAAVAGDAELRRRSRAELDRSIEKLLRVLTERADARGPLRGEIAPSVQEVFR